MKRKILRFALCWVLAMAAGRMTQARGEDDAGTKDTVVVPYDPGKPIEAQKQDQIYVPYERFLELWEAAKANKQAPSPEKREEEYVLSSGRYDATLGDGILHVSGTIDMQTLGEDWMSVPLEFEYGGGKLSAMQLDGQPVVITNDLLRVEKPGHHTLTVEFEVPVDKAKLITVGIPKTAGTLFTLTLPDKQMKADFGDNTGAVERVEGDRRIVTAALGMTNRVKIALDTSVGLATIKQAAAAKIQAAMTVTPEVESVTAGLVFSFPDSKQDHFTVTLEKGLSLVNLDAPNLKSWKLTAEGDRQTLEVTLMEPAKDSYQFSIRAERDGAGAERKFPYLSAVAARVEKTEALFAPRELRVTPHPAEGSRQVPFTGVEPGGTATLVAAYASTGDKELTGYGVVPAKVVNHAEITYVYQVNHTKIELVASLKLTPQAGGLFDMALGLPANFTVEAVESDRLKEWWREGGTLHARFRGEAPGMTQLVLHLVKLYPKAPDALEIQPVTLPAGWEVKGSGIIAAARQVAAGMTIDGAKEVNPQNAATDFRILAPMERKRGFEFKEQNFKASVTLETPPARVAGTWILSAQAHENRVSVSVHTELTVRAGSAAAAEFRLPANAPEARVNGDNVRETTSAVKGPWRVYRVAFQNELTDRAEFTTDLDLPAEAKVALPAFELEGVERSEGFVVTDNLSEYEMQTQTKGLDAAQSGDIPFLPQVTRNAQLYRAQPGWSLEIDLMRLEKEAGRAAFVAWAELTTAIRSDGSEWHRAVYHLQNRSLQFLPVSLPAGTELVSVSVAGENVRADQGQVDGKDVLLAPLIKTKPGDMSYDVEIVYRRRGTGGLWTFTHKTLTDPEVPGITVERTLWNLYVPEENGAGHFGGNMEEVLAEVNQTEKLEGMLQELKGLNIVLSMGRRKGAANAEENYWKLAKDIERQTATSNGMYAFSSPEPALKQSKAMEKQVSEVAKKKQAIQQELEKQNEVFENNKSGSITGAVGGLEAGKLADLPNQSWTANNAFTLQGGSTGSAGTGIDQGVAAGNKQLYVNDYVMNVQEQQGTQLKVFTGSQRLPGNVNMTLGGGALSAPAAPQAAMTSAGNGGGDRGQADMMESAKIEQQQAKGMNVSGQMAMDSTGAGAAAPSDVKVLNDARSKQAAADTQQLPTPSAPENRGSTQGNIAGLRSGAENMGNASDSDSTRAAAAAGEQIEKPVNAATSDVTGGNPAEGGQLHQAGAISLPVDFPTEGHLYHFKKLKANARLTFWMSEPQGLERWKWLLVFVVIATAVKLTEGKWKFRWSRGIGWR